MPSGNQSKRADDETVHKYRPQRSCEDPHSEHRERWPNKFDFIIACVGFAIGYGNVWRFPYLVYKNGGGAFLIPFFISVLLAGIPMFFLEVIQGQFMSGGCLKVWKMVPLFEGIGFASLIINFYQNSYYNILQTWSMRFLFASFSWTLPWSTCTNSWNTGNCAVGEPVPIIENNVTVGYLSSNNVTVTDITNLTDPAVEFWEREVLGISDSITEVGSIKGDLAICLLIAWLIVYVCIFNGIRTSGKVMYFTVPTPFILMIIIFIRGLTLPGAMKGIEFYLKPDFSRLTDIMVWADAGTQVLYSYSISLGVLNALGSFNPWHHNTLRDSFFFSIFDSMVCLLAGFIIFPVLGYMAEIKGVDISEVAEQGPGLVFIVYPIAISLMPAAPVWSIFFFGMLILVGIDTVFVAVEGFIAAINDYFPKTLASTIYRRAIFVGCVCVGFYLVGLTMITNGGMYVFQIVDYYTGSRITMLVALSECLVVAWIYGTDRFCKNMERMLRRPLGPAVKFIIKLMWNYITPAFVLSQFIVNTVQYTQSLVYKRSANKIYHFPGWAIGVGWTLAYSSVIFIPIVAAVKVFRSSDELSFADRIRHLTKPVLKSYMVLRGTSPDTYILENDEQEWEEDGGERQEIMLDAMLEEQNKIETDTGESLASHSVNQ